MHAHSHTHTRSKNKVGEEEWADKVAEVGEEPILRKLPRRGLALWRWKGIWDMCVCMRVSVCVACVCVELALRHG